MIMIETKFTLINKFLFYLQFTNKKKQNLIVQ